MQAHLLRNTQTQLQNDYELIRTDSDDWWYGYYYTSGNCVQSGCAIMYTVLSDKYHEGRLCRIRGKYMLPPINREPVVSNFYISLCKKEIMMM
jgi:hypothetical protein